MKYQESAKDTKLRGWFTSDMAHALLRGIQLKTGSFRGLNSLDIKFDYPISVIAGKNGAGKSTILALASCAFHAPTTSYKFPKRKNAYYTFSDFFIQHADEVPPQGLLIHYHIAHNNWAKTGVPTGTGIAVQERKKVRGGKWNDYDTRVPRTVVFLGIERIVPHSERSQSRSYSRSFKRSAPKGWEQKVMGAVGYILNKTYDKFSYLEHAKYSMPLVECEKNVYSGFNMGAGENALFEIFSVLYAAGEGALLVLDEIELGLHASAQRRLVERLKDACLETKSQIICTTHSKHIFECLPSEARFYVENIGGKTRVTPGVSSEFAFAKLSATTGNELDVLVEDDVAKAILLASLPASVRARISIKIIGSANALARQLAAIYVRGELKPAIAIFDGDQAAHAANLERHARNMAETVKADFSAWFKAKVSFLPGITWPEAWLLTKAEECIEAASASVSCEPDELRTYIEYGHVAGKHKELREISNYLGLDRSDVLQMLSSVVAQNFAEELMPISAAITTALNANS